MARNETQAHHDMETAYGRVADERARWAAVLARPTNRPVRKPAKRASLLARILGALFA